MEQPSASLVIVGASVRAAAQSAIRAGFAPLACDLFADVDLRRICSAVRVNGYPQGLASAAAGYPPAPWLYTGGLENHPELVDQIGRDRPLLGVRGDALRAVRNPFRVVAAMQKHGLPCPRCGMPETAVAAGRNRRTTDVLHDEWLPEGWLLKRRASAGGAGVRPWRGVLPSRAGSNDYYLQQRVAGRACSAVYIGAAGRSTLLGVTEQLIGAAWCGGRRFHYCGSLGPLRLRTETVRRFRRIGDCLAAEFSLVGLFGVDAIVNRRGVWPVEVNPRYTASVEVLERALGIRALRWHVEACRDGRLPDEDDRLAGGPKLAWCGKAILFARRDIVIDQRLADLLIRRSDAPSSQAWPPVADVPATGSRIAAHRPILTVLAEEDTRQSVLQRLQSAASHLRTEIEPA